jgi:hypothetical protein
MLRSRIWRAISAAASRLTGVDDVFFSSPERFLWEPVLTSMEMRASVSSMMISPPEGSGTLALAGLLDLALDVEALEDRDAVLVERDLALGAALGDLADVFLRALVVVLVVDEHAVDVLGEEVAHGALDDVGLLVEAGGGAVGLHLALDLLPLGGGGAGRGRSSGLLAFAGGADDDAHALGDGELVDEGLEALALGGVLDLAGDAAAVGERREDEVAAGEGEVGRGARALGADGALGDLDDDLGAGRVEAGDVLDGGLGLASGRRPSSC